MQADRLSYSKRATLMNRQAGKKTPDAGRQTTRQANIHTGTQTDEQLNNQTNNQADKQTGRHRQTYKQQAEKQTYRLRGTNIQPNIETDKQQYNTQKIRRAFLLIQGGGAPSTAQPHTEIHVFIYLLVLPRTPCVRAPREPDIQTDRQTDKHTDRDRQRDTDGHTDRQTDRQTGGQTNKGTDTETETETE